MRKIDLKLKQGLVQLSVPAQGILRLRFASGKAFEPKVTPVRRQWPARPGGRLLHKNGVSTLETQGLSLSLAEPSLGLTLLDGVGDILFQSQASCGVRPLKFWTSQEFSTAGGPDAQPGVVVSRTPAHGVAWSFRTPAQPAWYGLGEKTGPLDRAGRVWENWNTDAFQYGPVTDPLYKSVPFLLGSSLGRRGRTYWGLFLDNASRTRFDLGRLDVHDFSYEAAEGDLDAWFLAGPEPAQVLERYTWLTGRPFLPPLWSVGVHQSRYSYMSQAEVSRVAAGFRKRGLPLDCIHLDIDYMRGFRVFTWDPKRFSDPKGLLKSLKKQGLHATAIVDPGIKKDPGFKVYQDGLKKGVFCETSDGEVFSGKVWPAQSVFADFFDPKAAAWWGEQHQPFLQLGIDGIWNDMNEPALFDKGTMQAVVHRTEAGPRPHDAVHNLFGQAMTAATARALKKLDPRRRHFLLTRSAYAGIQASSAVWLGDNASSWEHLEMSLTMLQGVGLSGIPFCGVDVGGFDKDCTAELLCRWVEACCLTPFFRNHSVQGSRPQEPWAFGEPALSIYRKHLQLRFRLMPYLYGLFEESRRTGAPILRPMLFGYPQEPAAANLGHQFLVGPSLLVAPVMRPGTAAREVWLPPGIWTAYETGQRWEGGRFVLAEAPLDTLPIFVKEGSVLPGWRAGLNVDTRDRQVLTLDLYPGKSLKSSYELYEDDGESFGFDKGIEARRRFSLESSEKAIRLSLGRPVGPYASPLKRLYLRFHNLAGRPHRVLVDRKPWDFARQRDGEVVHGLQPGHFQARLEVPMGTGEILLEGASVLPAVS
jgi:alpha-glucosidase